MNAEEWFGSQEWIHRAVGLSLHLACALLLWFVLRELNFPLSWLAAVLFAVHPGGIGAISRVDQHGRLWAAAFGLAAVLLLLKILPVRMPQTDVKQEKRPQWEADWYNPEKVRRRRIRFSAGLALALLFAWAAALCQPGVGVLIGPVVVILVLWQHRQLNQSRWATFAVLAPFVLLAISAAIGGWNTEMTWERSSFLRSINTSAWVRSLWAIGWSARWAILPYPANGQTGFIRSAVGPNTMAFGVAVVAGLLLATLGRRRFGYGLLASLVCFVVCVPTLFAPLAAFRAASSVSGGGDGDTYLLSIPWIAIGVALLFLLARRLSNVSAQLSFQFAAGAALIVLLSLATAADAKYFASPEHVLEADFIANPTQDIRARFARLLITEGKFTKAAHVLGGIKPEECTDPTLAIAEGDLLRINAKPGAAIVWLLRAQALDSKDAEVADRVAEVEVQLGRGDDAAETFKRAIEQHPADAPLKNGYAQYLAKSGEVDAAMEQLHAAILAQPEYAPAHVTIAMILMDEKKYSEAAEQLLAAYRLDARNFDAAHTYGVVLLHDHKLEEATRYLGIAVSIRPGSPEAHNDFGVALSYTGKLKRAITEFQRSIALNPKYATASKNLQAAIRKANEEGNGF